MVNHLYQCAASTDGNGELMFAKWESMAHIYQNGHRARAGKVGQLPHIILWIRLAAATPHLLASQSRFIGYRRTWEPALC